MTDHMQTPLIPGSMETSGAAPAQGGQGGCPFGHGSGSVATAHAAHAAHAPHVPPADDDGWHNAQLDFSKSMSYGDYLSLGSILSAQHPLSPDHN
jgi:tryptophan 2,3-dioxygenase